MYNNATEHKIKDIPKVGNIDIERLPQELTKIYAYIVSLRRQVADGTLAFQDDELLEAKVYLRKLANNLEILLLANPEHGQRESIAFVAATANHLIHKMSLKSDRTEALLEENSISSYIAAIILFLIGNSQADAAETAISADAFPTENLTQQRLISAISALAKGRLRDITRDAFPEKEVVQVEDFQQTALNYLWRELGLGIRQIANRLLEPTAEPQQDHFEKVMTLCVSEPGLFDKQSVFAGPYRLAKLLQVLAEDILDRAVIDIPPPKGVDRERWFDFLQRLAHSRPYLWENHKEAVSTNFLDEGISAVLTLPTGAGKSTLSELKIAATLYSGRKVIFLVPTHALEDQVNRNLRRLFHEFESPGIELGGEYSDLAELEEFPILVMTPERCLTFLNIAPDFFNEVGLVVFDEFHLIHGTDIRKDRRAIDAMYCLLSLFSVAQEADYLLISAMVENGNEIASWIEDVTGRECKIFNSSWKPTRQLHGCLVFEEDEIKELYSKLRDAKASATTKAPSKGLQRQMTADPLCFFSLKNIWETDEDEDYFKSRILDHKVYLGAGNWGRLTSNRNDVAADLALHFAKLGLKTLVFVDRPITANFTANKIANELQDNGRWYEDFCQRNRTIIDVVSSELGNVEYSFFHDRHSVGVHHGLLLPLERLLIENYFKYSHGSKVLVATATLAQGINLPAEIVIIAGDDRYDEEDERRLNVQPHELLNAAGRAGRAGLSSQGAVILIPGDIVTIKDSTISDRWWQLKNDVFSKGDQCLEVEDPLGYFLDSLQEQSGELSVDQTNILYRFRPENMSQTETSALLGKSFRAFSESKKGNREEFDVQVRMLLDRRSELDDLPDEFDWQKEIGIKTGVEPNLIMDLDAAIEEQGLFDLLDKDVVELIDWFFGWLRTDESYLEKIFSKSSTVAQMKKAVGLKPEASVKQLIDRIKTLQDIVFAYIKGRSLFEINELIPNVNLPDRTGFLVKARNFVNRLVPELSFGFGILSMVLSEKAIQEGIDEIPYDIKMLASCVREGFDDVEKLFYKKNNRLLARVETHLKFQTQS